MEHQGAVIPRFVLSILMYSTKPDAWLHVIKLRRSLSWLLFLHRTPPPCPLIHQLLQRFPQLSAATAESTLRLTAKYLRNGICATDGVNITKPECSTLTIPGWTRPYFKNIYSKHPLSLSKQYIGKYNMLVWSCYFMICASNFHQH